MPGEDKMKTLKQECSIFQISFLNLFEVLIIILYSDEKIHKSSRTNFILLMMLKLHFIFPEEN